MNNDPKKWNPFLDARKVHRNLLQTGCAVIHFIFIIVECSSNHLERPVP